MASAEFDSRIVLESSESLEPTINPLFGQIVFAKSIKLHGSLINFGTAVLIGSKRLFFLGFLVLKTTQWVIDSLVFETALKI